MATGATIKAVEGFDKDGLKKAETTEKNPLPDKEGMYDRLLYWKMILAILQLFQMILNDYVLNHLFSLYSSYRSRKRT